MPAQQVLPLLDLSTAPTNIAELRRGIRKWGAFRLLAPGIHRAFARGVPHRRKFFLSKTLIKERTKGYLPFGAIDIRGENMAKETLYGFRKRDQNAGMNEPPPELFGPVTECDPRLVHPYVIAVSIADELDRQAWSPLRPRLFEFISNKLLESPKPLTGTPSLDYETLGLHHYAPHRMVQGECDYSPPHKDGGTLTILVRENGYFDGLEVADLETTKERDSERIGLEASFLPVPVAADEVIVFIGTRMQRMVGEHIARACVHRVRAPTQTGNSAVEDRFSFAIFCAPPV
ncbi:hypothetical protein N7523_005709 [Penicillium sp. IBT 18751x]|nr:hypothetical protein N7523_005709 [Penicillium sp. IBT 18751x]